MQPLPQNTNIKYKQSSFVWVILSPLILVLSIYLLITSDGLLQKTMAIFGSVVGLVLTFINLKDVSEFNRPQFIISKIGLEHRNGQHLNWADILTYKIVYLGRHHAVPHLSIKTTEGDRLFKIAEWDIVPEKLLDLITQYNNEANQTG